MIIMRAMRGIWCLQCLLLTGTAQATSLPPAPAPPTTAAQAATPGAPAAGAAAPQPLSPQDLLFACPTSLDHIGRVVAAVMVDGRGPFRFIIDTGANHSTISPHLAAVLGLQPSIQQAMRVIGITGTAEVASVLIEKLQVGDLVISHSRLPIIEAPIMAGADGILGAAGLQDERLLVDFRHNRVVITRSHGDSVPWGFTRVRATQLKGGLLSVPGEVGDVRVAAVIDTGSQHTLGNQALYQALYTHERGKGTYLDTDVYGATQQVGTGRLQLAPVIDLGALKIDGVALVFGDFHIFKAWGLTTQPTIILGMDVLGTVQAFAVDFRYGEVGIATLMNAESAVREGFGCRFNSGSATFGCGD
jgi:predicted aspartyl protease